MIKKIVSSLKQVKQKFIKRRYVEKYVRNQKDKTSKEYLQQYSFLHVEEKRYTYTVSQLQSENDEKAR